MIKKGDLFYKNVTIKFNDDKGKVIDLSENLDLIKRNEKLENVIKEILAQIDFPEHRGYIKQICQKALEEI